MVPSCASFYVPRRTAQGEFESDAMALSWLYGLFELKYGIDR